MGEGAILLQANDEGIEHPVCYFSINPDSIPPSDRRWLLVARSADFADVGPTVACQPLFMLDFSIFCRLWADVGPTVDFYSRWRRAIIGDLGKLRKKLLIMVYLKVIFQSAHKF